MLLTLLVAVPLFIHCGEKKPDANSGTVRIFKPDGPARQQLLNKARVMSSVAFDNFQNGFLKKALDNYQSAVSNLTLIDNTIEIGRVYSNIGSVYIKMGNYTAARDWLSRALAIGKRYGDLVLQSDALNTLGLSYEVTTNFAKALENYREIIKLIPPKREYYHILSKQFNNIGYLLYLGKEYTKAIQHFLRSIQFNRENRDLLVLAESYTYLGECYIALNRLQPALIYFLNALNADKANENPPGIAANLKNMGRVYMLLQRPGKAVQFFERAVQINLHLKLHSRVIKDLEYLITAARRSGLQQKADEYSRFLEKLKKSVKQ